MRRDDPCAIKRGEIILGFFIPRAQFSIFPQRPPVDEGWFFFYWTSRFD